MKLISTNPAKDYEILGEVDISTDEEIKEKVDKANKAKLMWKELGITKRIEFVKKISKLFEEKQEEIILLVTREMGKPLSESRAEVEWCFTEIEEFIEMGKKALQDEITFEDENEINKIVYEPWGSVAAITPWNFPFEMFVWAVFPNLIAGNTVVFKMTEECPLLGKLIDDIMASSDLPSGVFSAAHGAGDIGAKLVERDIDMIWFTGSTKTGKYLYNIAAKKFIKAMLEMGGSNPGIIFEDIDTKEIVDDIYLKRFKNCGQICMSLKRLIVHESIFDEMVEELKKKVKTKVVGDPEEQDTDVGSLAAKRQLELLESQVQDAVDKGAKVVCGGKRPTGLKGAYYEPTLLTNITTDMRVWKEETFGPVLSIVPFKTEEEAIKLANDTIYGLGSVVYTKDKKRQERIASRIEAGTVEINGANRWKDCNPFGGYKFSGMGREHGIMGFRELCQIKVVAFKK